MDASEVLKKIAEGFKSVLASVEPTTEPTETQTFKDVKTQDGLTILSYDGETPAPQMPVFVMDESGQRLPAPDGDYILEDGSTLKVQGGIIMEVVAGGAPAEPPAEGAVENADANAGTPQAQVPQVPKSVIESIVKEYHFQEQLDELKTSLEAKDATITELTEKLTKAEGETAKFSKAFKDLTDLVVKIADQPATDSKTEKKDAFIKETNTEPVPEAVAEFRKKHLNNHF